MVNRTNWNTSRGGDSVQMENTAKVLRKLGVQVTYWEPTHQFDFKQFDLIHLFNIIRPEHLMKFTNLGVPFVVSTIFVDYEEVDKLLRGNSFRAFQNIAGNDRLQYVKTLARSVKGKSEIPNFSYRIKGQAESISYIAKKAAMLLPNSMSEAQRFVAKYPHETPIKVIPNGVSKEKFIHPCDNPQKDVLCVARFEHLKNQINLMHAIVQTDLKLTLVGDPSPNQHSYYQQCLEFAKKHPQQIEILTQYPSEKLPELYKQYKIHILPSWFETTGLVNLEAAAAGCNVIISNRGDTHEYFGDRADYCDPGDVASIKNALIKVSQTPSNDTLRQHVLQHFTWELAAQNTLEAYQEVLND